MTYLIEFVYLFHLKGVIYLQKSPKTKKYVIFPKMTPQESENLYKIQKIKAMIKFHIKTMSLTIF